MVELLDGPEGRGARLLDDVAAFITTYVAFPTPHALTALTLWAAHTHALDCFESTPRMALLSPEPGSGKTRSLEALELLVPEPMFTLNASAPAIFRTIEKARPTLLFDEVDAIFAKRGKDDSAEDLRALLNAGHRRGATIPRCVGPRHDVTRFPVFAAVALAGLGDLPETLMTRSVIIRMRPRSRGEHVRPFRIREAEPVGHELAGRLALWAKEATDDLRDAWPTMPAGVSDRPADVWEPLLAVADAAGGDWPERARSACVELCKVVASREASLGVLLLTDLRAVFGDDDRLGTETILTTLHALEESPWGDLAGRPLDARGLARFLGRYDVHSTKVKVGDKSVRGYQREDLWAAWEHYLTSTPAEAEPAEPPEPPTSEGVAQVPLPVPVPEPEQRTEPDAYPVTSPVPQVPEVPDMRERSNGAGVTKPNRPARLLDDPADYDPDDPRRFTR